MLLTMAPTVAFAAEDDEAANTISLADATETSGTSTTIEDIYQNKWTVTTAENCITMEQGDNKITATLDNDVLTVAGTGAMPVLNDSTDAVSGSQLQAYPWAGWNGSVKRIVISDGITGVGSKSFIAWKNVTAVELGNDVKTIGAGALAQLTACTQFTVSKSNPYLEAVDGVLYSKGQKKLYYYPCAKSNVADLTMPDSVTELGYNAICRNASLQTISFVGDNALHLGFGSLFGNTALATVNLGRTNVTLDTMVFNNDAALKVVYCKTSEIKAEVNKMIGAAGSGAVALLEGGQYNLQDGNGYVYAIDSEGAISYGYKGKETELVIPAELGGKAVTTIASDAFSNLDGSRKITKVTIPASVKVIESYAFVGYKDASKPDSTLTNVTILGTDVEVGTMAFARHTNLRIDMTSVEKLNAEKNAFYGVSNIIVAKVNQENLRTALAENDSLAQTTRVYVDTDQNNNFYWHYENDKWAVVSSGTTSLTDKQGLNYTVNYAVDGTKVTATAKITGYKEPEGSAAKELIIPKTLPFTSADGNEAQATVISISGLRGESNQHIQNGIKTLTIKADLAQMATTFVYWDDLETVNVVGNVKKLSNCFGGGNSLKKAYFGNQDNIVLGSAVFGNSPSLDVIDLSEVKNVEMISEPGYDNRITNFYGMAGITMVYVENEDVYKAINTVSFASTIKQDNGKTITTSGFNKDHNIVAITNGGTFDAKPTSNTTLAIPTKTGYTFDGWYSSSNFAEGTKLTDNNHPVTGTTYYAKWTEKTTPAIAIKATPSTLTGGGSVELTVSDVPTKGKLAVTCDNDITVNEKDGKYTYTAQLPNATKDYTFTAKYTGTNNYNDVEKSCKVSVTYKGSSHHSSSTSNTVSASTASNGKVSLDKNTAKKGDTVTVTVTPDAGYQLDKLTITDAKGKTVDVTKKSDGKFTFTMPDSKVEIKAVFAKKVETSPFGDVSTDAYYYKAVQWAQEKGITDGISSNLFGPKQPCTRSQIVTFLWRAAGSPEPKSTAAGMTDVVPGSYYAKAVAWAVENGITTGTAEGKFSPDATCTRAQAVTFLARAQNAKATGKTAFSDVPADSYFADAVAWAQANGVTTGTSETTFSPDSDCTRAQIVTFLYRANQGT